MFEAEGIIPQGGSKYQGAGVSEKVVITELTLLESNGYQNFQFKTLNEFGKEGQSKRLSLKTEVSPGKTVSAWKVSAKYLQNLIISGTGMSVEQSQAVLKADSVAQLKQQIESAVIGKTVRGLFSSREYQTGKFAIELYTTEEVGGTRLVFDKSNKNHNSLLEVMASGVSGGDSLPF